MLRHFLRLLPGRPGTDLRTMQDYLGDRNPKAYRLLHQGRLAPVRGAVAIAMAAATAYCPVVISLAPPLALALRPSAEGRNMRAQQPPPARRVRIDIGIGQGSGRMPYKNGTKQHMFPLRSASWLDRHQ